MERKPNDVVEDEVCTVETSGASVPVERALAPQQPDAAADVATAPESRVKARKFKSEVTLADLAERYLTYMKTRGKSNGTVISYRQELVTAMNELGGKTRLADLTPKKVGAYFASPRVNKTLAGRPKNRLSIAKTQRVLRLALVWAADARLIGSAPIPLKATTL